MDPPAGKSNQGTPASSAWWTHYSMCTRMCHICGCDIFVHMEYGDHQALDAGVLWVLAGGTQM